MAVDMGTRARISKSGCRIDDEWKRQYLLLLTAHALVTHYTECIIAKLAIPEIKLRFALNTQDIYISKLFCRNLNFAVQQNQQR